MTRTSPKNTSDNGNNSQIPSVTDSTVGKPVPATNYSQDSAKLFSEQQKIVRKETPKTSPQNFFRWWRSLNLRLKVTMLAVAMGTIPVLTIGGIAYQVANRSVTAQISRVQVARTKALANQFSQFLEERYREVELLTAEPMFSDPQLWERATLEQKKAVLDRFQSKIGSYDSIAFFDLKGNTLFQSDSSRPIQDNYSDRTYYQQALQTQQITLNDFQTAQSSGRLSIEFAAPVQQNGKLVGIVRTRIPIQNIETILRNFDDGNSVWHLLNSEGTIIASANQEHADKSVGQMLPQWAQLPPAKQSETGVYRNLLQDNQKSLVTYAPVDSIDRLPKVNAGTLITINADIAFAPQRQLLGIILLGTITAALLVTAIAAILAYRLTNPIVAAVQALKKIGQGELDTRLEVTGEDEIAALGFNINRMAGQIKNFIEAQQFESERTKLLKDITLHLFQSLDRKEIFEIAVADIREFLKTDRVIVYTFNENWQGTIIAESVGEDWPQALGATIDDPCFAQDYVEKYIQGRVQPTPDIYQAGLTECYLQQLEPFGVRANLVAPIVMAGQLLGLLIAHQCSGPRNWLPPEIDLFAQLAVQVGLALDRANLEQEKIGAAEQRTAKEELQQRALELLKEVYPISQGDLTIRAKVTTDEMGTIADAYNATVGSLLKIVTQVQIAAEQVVATTSNHQLSIQVLSDEAIEQAMEIESALILAQEMTQSVKAVATQAEQAEAFVQQAAQIVEEGDADMSQTVEGMLSIQETVEQTAQKVKLLGESSQKISTVVNLISKFAKQSNLLALNASIEAARAGEKGQGFAVVAEEVRSLAQQSAQATSEIEKLVADIQAETQEVTLAMEAGTNEVVKGTQLVDKTRQSLNKIKAASAEINTLFEAIAQTTITHKMASEAVTQTLTNVAAMSDKTSQETKLVSSSFEQLQAVAQLLQKNIGQFKVK
ncbi:methyl-accepting chemotaxis protein [Lyngbya aestuarii]|uniref:methyl-accepting chemotaxis protein n=1 Tax=Lyngbya aestuarii TaxID=118322 RepID=UPI00403E239A